MKGLINIKNNDNKCFLWCHIRHFKIHSERITKADKIWSMILIMKTWNFLSQDFTKTEKKNNICTDVFYYKKNLVYVSSKKFANCMDLLLTVKKGRSDYVYIKDFNRFMCNKTKCKNKKHFCKCCPQCFSRENILVEREQIVCLKMVNRL